MSRVTRQQDIAALAVNSFTKHSLSKKAEGDGAIQVWRCADPTTSHFAFWVTILPYTVIVSGDIGDNILNVSDRDPLSWVVGVCGERTSYDYVASKIRTSDKTFDPDKARDWLQYLLDDKVFGDDESDEKRYKDVKAILDDRYIWDNGDTSGYAFYEACYEANLDPEDVGHDYSEDHYWTIEALRAFARLYRKEQILRGEG